MKPTHVIDATLCALADYDLSTDLHNAYPTLRDYIKQLEKEAEKLDLVRHLVESDAGFESDGVHLDIIQGRKVDDRTKILADLVSQTYRIVHPSKDCPHKDWEEETENAIARYNESVK